MKIRANILSKSDQVPSLEWLRNFTRSVPVYHMPSQRVVGGIVAGSLQIDGDDVWAELEIEDGTPRFQRAAGFVVDGENGRELVMVMLSNLTKAQLRSL